MAGVAITAGTRVTAQLSGSYNLFTNNEATFKSNLQTYLQMQPVNVLSVDVKGGTVGYGIGIPYTATVVVTALSSTNESSLAAVIQTAAEAAGSYAPSVSLVSQGQPTQPSLPTPSGIGGLVDATVQATGDALRGVGSSLQALPFTANALIVGVVIVVALVALGPNLKGIGRRL